MIIKNTFTTKDIKERLARQAAIHRRCILLLQVHRAEG